MINCFVASDEHKAIHNFIHDQLSNYGYRLRQTSLRDLYDIYLITSRLRKSQNTIATDYAKKYAVYLIFTQAAFQTNGAFSILENGRAANYKKQHDWFLNHPRAHSVLFVLMRLYQLVFTWFLFKTGNFIFSKSYRKGIFRRLKDPDWYYRSVTLIKTWFYRYIIGKEI